VVMSKLDGADHGGSPFWTDDILKIVDDFLREHVHGKRLETLRKILAWIRLASRATATSEQVNTF